MANGGDPKEFSNLALNIAIRRAQEIYGQDSGLARDRWRQLLCWERVPMPGEDFRLPVLARNRLRAELRKHPEITRHLAVDTQETPPPTQSCT